MPQLARSARSSRDNIPIMPCGSDEAYLQSATTCDALTCEDTDGVCYGRRTMLNLADTPQTYKKCRDLILLEVDEEKVMS